MTFTANIARKHAESARRRAQEIWGKSETSFMSAANAELRECVAIWNAFCAEEQARLDRRAKRVINTAEILPGCWVPTR